MRADVANFEVPGRPDCVVFDWDGVLLDSLPGLRGAYAAFAREHGFEPSAHEFDALNGPSVPEIVAFLKREHQLNAPEAALLQSYQQHVERAYQELRLADGAREVLTRVRALGLRVALATSAQRAVVQDALSRTGIASYFDIVVTGDEVAHAKPAADIYLRVAGQLAQDTRCYVIEDAPHGVRAALSAGMAVVQLAPDAPLEDGVLGSPTTLVEACRIILAARQHCRWLGSCSSVELRVTEGALAIEPELEAAVQGLWRARIAQQPSLRDGKILSYRSHQLRDGHLAIEAGVASYRHFVAALTHPEWRVPVAPLGVSGAAFDCHGHTMLAERHAVTQHVGSLELVPSGGIDERHHTDAHASAEAQLRDEWVEETQLAASSIQSVQPIGLMRAEDGLVYDICFRIDVAPSIALADCRLSGEYLGAIAGTPLKLMQYAQGRPMVPVSRALLGMLV
jgi:HAD superfamily hydrolase (TIGR01509 family)